MSDGIHTYTGPWINWSEGVIRGATLTLSQKHSGVLSAFLAILVYPMNGDYYGANGQMARYGPGCRHLAVSTVTISFAGTLFWSIQALSFIKPIPRNRQRARCTACPAPDHSPQQDRRRCSVGFDHAAIWEWVNSIASQGHWTVPTIGDIGHSQYPSIQCVWSIYKLHHQDRWQVHYHHRTRLWGFHI
jgi:hypothetical protein